MLAHTSQAHTGQWGYVLDFLFFQRKAMLRQAYFGQKPEEHCFSIKKHCLEAQNEDFREKWVTEKIGDSKLIF